MNRPLDFGVCVTLFHPPVQSPAVALEYDRERVAPMDRLGFDEAWFGEHHSGDDELIARPQAFIAAAAARTKNLTLATSVHPRRLGASSVYPWRRHADAIHPGCTLKSIGSQSILSMRNRRRVTAG